MKKMAMACILAGAMVVAGAAAVRADVQDSSITTRSHIALLTNDDFSVTGAAVETSHGKVTITGTVATEADRNRAGQTVRGVTGVKSVKNLLQVVPTRATMVTIVTDADVKDRVEASLKTDARMNDVTVTSVTGGKVLLAGTAEKLGDNLRAIENAYSVPGVQRVSSDIRTAND